MAVEANFGAAAVSAASVIVTILLHWFSTTDSEQERQDVLRQELLEEDSGWCRSKRGNRFNLTITDIKVQESERLWYQILLKPLPVIGGFNGETAIIARIEGDVWLEEWALIKYISETTDFQGMVADFQLDGDELIFVLNTAEESEIRTRFTGVVRAIKLNDRHLAEETVSESDYMTLGQNVGGGVARPLFADVSFPTQLIYRLLSFPLKGVIKYQFGSMNRSFVWVRNTPMRRTSTTELRIRYPNQEPEPKEINIRDWWYIYLNPEKCSEGGIALLQMLHMGYRIHRNFAEKGEATVKQGVTCLELSIAELRESVDLDQTHPDSRDLATGYLALNSFGGLTNAFQESDRTHIEVPIDNCSPHIFEEIDQSNLSEESKQQLALLLNSGVRATAITGLGNGLVQAYYRSGDGAWYFTVRWGEQGQAEFREIGTVDPADPIETEGYVIWEKLHPGGRTTYAPRDISESGSTG